MRGHEEYREMLAAHALGALETAEARELDAHLAVCAGCRSELGSWSGTAANLVYAAPAIEPSAGLRAQILASVRADTSQARTRREAGDNANLAKPVQTTGNDSHVVPFTQRTRRGWTSPSRVMALAASVAFVALVISLILLWSRYNAANQEIVRLSDRLNQTQGELNREREAVARQREAIEMVTAPEARVSTLAGTDMAKSAYAKFVLDRDTGRAILMAYNLPKAPAGKAYQLWYIAEGKPPMPGHVFTPDVQGHAEMHDMVPAEARSAKAFAVTLEPESGVQTPTEPMYLMSAAL